MLLGTTVHITHILPSKEVNQQTQDLLEISNDFLNLFLDMIFLSMLFYCCISGIFTAILGGAFKDTLVSENR